ncbi:ATP-binding protein [Arabiibacter massiliensis]|uniref:ATP-binding protein n=1 Tax=Arabiibacter massiliensis TaxID=1870985 RepID=UPI0009B9F8FE|nr:ATP-binding protein [Arabiibacter massiliensis]
MTGEQLIAAASLGALAAAAVVLMLPRRDVAGPRRWSNLLLPASQLALAAFMFHHIVASGLPEWLFALVAGTCFACALGDVVLFRALWKAERADVEAERARLLEEQVAMQDEHRARLEADLRDAGRVREQLAAELDRVDELLQAHELAEVPGQLDRAARAMKGAEGRWCEHPVVDALVAAKARTLADAGVRFDARLNVPEDLPLPDVELCALFSNTLDNALHACAKVPAEGRFVELRARSAGGFFLLDMANACTADATAQGPLAKAKRPVVGGHGWGLRILQTIAARHAGTCSFEREEGVFRTSVALELPRA